MKAIRLHRRGGPEDLVYEDAPAPSLSPGDALVRVMASSLTPTELTWNETYSNCDGSQRLPTIPGHEFSGVVDGLSEGASGVTIGEEVYALTSFCRNGSAAEYVAVHAADLAPKPKTLSHSEAAAVPLSALTVWQAFFDHADIGSGKRVLVHAAAGGVGTFAVQIARWCGAHTIGTASADNRDLVLSLGADEVIDYRATRFEEIVSNIDLVLDTIGGETRERSWQVLNSTGILIALNAPISESDAKRGRHGKFFIVEPNRDQLEKIAGLIDSGLIKPVIAGTTPLSRARQAFEQAAEGHTRGKLVLEVAKG
jgi:NADPH:quinone reductase-like Zn-dependent oxidoreductase